MKKTIIATMLSMFLFVVTHSAELSSKEVLRKSDRVENAAKDMTNNLTMTLIDKDGDEKVREAKVMQKGDSKRIMKFLSPGDIKGVGILSLPNDVIYFYMPAFNKIRRIASHVKNQSFMGTDLTYDDFSAINYSDEYDVKSMKEEGNTYLLELAPKKGVKKDYDKLLIWVGKENYYRTKIEYYKGSLLKVMERNDIKKIGKYWIAQKFSMKDLKKNHSTVMVIKDIKFDQGLSDKVFSKRSLKRK